MSNFSIPAQGAQGLAVSSEGVEGGADEPGLGGGHHISTDATGLSLPGSHYGLTHSQGAGLAYLEHTGSGLLHRGFE